MHFVLQNMSIFLFFFYTKEKHELQPNDLAISKSLESSARMFVFRKNLTGTLVRLCVQGSKIFWFPSVPKVAVSCKVVLKTMLGTFIRPSKVFQNNVQAFEFPRTLHWTRIKPRKGERKNSWCWSLESTSAESLEKVVKSQMRLCLMCWLHLMCFLCMAVKSV